MAVLGGGKDGAPLSCGVEHPQDVTALLFVWPQANAPSLIPDSYPAPRCRDEALGEGRSVDDYVIDSDSPVDLAGAVRRTKTETRF